MNKITKSIIITLLALFTTSCSSIKDDHTLKNTVVEYTFPAEWEDHEGTWLIWPHDYGVIVSEYVDMIDDIWVTMTKALHTGERVHIVAYDAQERNRITTILEQEGVDMSQVDFLLAETDQFWARDCGPCMP